MRNRRACARIKVLAQPKPIVFAGRRIGPKGFIHRRERPRTQKRNPPNLQEHARRLPLRRRAQREASSLAEPAVWCGTGFDNVDTCRHVTSWTTRVVRCGDGARGRGGRDNLERSKTPRKAPVVATRFCPPADVERAREKKKKKKKARSFSEAAPIPPTKHDKGQSVRFDQRLTGKSRNLLFPGPRQQP